MAGRFTLRSATNGDGAAVRALVGAVLDEFGLAADPAATDADLRDLEAAYTNTGGAFTVVEDASGMIVGCIGLYRVDDDTCELRKMYLEAHVRGVGLGRQLLDHALAEAARLGFQRVVLETASVLKKAIRLYTSYGFRPFESGHLSCRCDQAYYLDLRLNTR